MTHLICFNSWFCIYAFFTWNMNSIHCRYGKFWLIYFHQANAKQYTLDDVHWKGNISLCVIFFLSIQVCRRAICIAHERTMTSAQVLNTPTHNTNTIYIHNHSKICSLSIIRTHSFVALAYSCIRCVIESLFCSIAAKCEFPSYSIHAQKRPGVFIPNSVLLVSLMSVWKQYRWRCVVFKTIHIMKYARL